MFNDRYGLTQAVIEGRKTMTRRIMNYQSGNLAGCVGFTKNGRACTYVRADFDNGISEDAPYAIGEIVAVAQSYRDVCAGGFEPDATILRLFEERRIAGWTNKMFTKAELMPYRIRITGIKCERLQDISDEDCMKEGVLGDVEYDKYEVYGLFGNSDDGFDTPREAFASLIDKISSCGTWAHNPWVVVYEFELVK